MRITSKKKKKSKLILSLYIWLMTINYKGYENRVDISPGLIDKSVTSFVIFKSGLCLNALFILKNTHHYTAELLALKMAQETTVVVNFTC